MEIKNSKYILNSDGKTNGTVSAVIDGKSMSIPMVVGNRHYDEILKQVEEGKVTIEEAD